MSTGEQTSTRAAPKGGRASKAGQVVHLTLAERSALGKAARGEVSRSTHGDWKPSPDRPDPIDVLEEQAKSRVPELVPIRYGRMLVSPFTFYRGAAALMACDLAPGPRTGLDTQLCGDAHLSNFGVFAAPDRRLVFGINDFDETLPGPFEWDVKRLVASFAVAGRDRGFGPEERAGINAAAARSYRESMHRFAGMGNLDLWYARFDVEQLAREYRERASATQKKRLDRNLAKTRAKDSLRAFGKLTEVVDGERRIVSDPPLIVRIDDLLEPGDDRNVQEEFAGFIRAYRSTLPDDRRRLIERFHYVDAARKVVGVGSVGTRAWIVLLVGRDSDDPLFMQAKEAQSSVLEPYLGKSSYSSCGQRVVEGQRLMQAASDILLGWLDTRGLDGVQRDFYVRQLWDAKGSARVELMEPDAMTEYAQLCGWTLAKAHARSGDPVAIASYLGKSKMFDEALSVFAESYADQNERDYAALREAVESGRIAAETGL